MSIKTSDIKDDCITRSYDVYQKVADRTGTTRAFVKLYAYHLIYISMGLSPDSGLSLEDQLVAYVNLVKTFEAK